jgi:hypothetical protein
MKSNMWLLIASGVFLLAGGIAGYFGFPEGNENSLTLSAVVLVGFAMIVLLMAVLVIVYQVLGLADWKQALALPEGSVRALIAFSLVLVFVCLAAFLYNSVNSADLNSAAKATRITQQEVKDLKTLFVVTTEPAKDEKGTALFEPKLDGKGAPQYEPKLDDKGAPSGVPDTTKPQFDTTKPLYNATYYARRSKDASDFAKQIFTTLATVFVSVISFYFGSSATASGVGVGAKAARDGGDGSQKGDPQLALSGAKASAHDAQSAADRATTAAQSAAELADKAPEDKKAAAQDNAKKAKEQSALATQAAKDASQQVATAGKAATDATAMGIDPTKASTAAADAIKARDAAKDFAEKAKRSADEAERLLQQIKTDTGAI